MMHLLFSLALRFRRSEALKILRYQLKKLNTKIKVCKAKINRTQSLSISQELYYKLREYNEYLISKELYFKSKKNQITTIRLHHISYFKKERMLFIESLIQS